MSSKGITFHFLFELFNLFNVVWEVADSLEYGEGFGGNLVAEIFFNLDKEGTCIAISIESRESRPWSFNELCKVTFALFNVLK